MLKHKIGAVVFDADGVVLKTNHFSKRYSDKFGVPIEAILEYIKGEHQLCLLGQADFKTEITKYLDRWGWNKSVDELVEFWFSGEQQRIPQTTTVIENLRNNGVPIYLATNQVKDRTNYFKQKLGFGEVFTEIYSSAELGVKKPDLNFYHALIKGLSMEPSKILFIDDEPKNVEGEGKLELLLN